MDRLHVFIDESGDEHLNISSGASKNYVLAAVIIREEDLGAVTEEADSVRRRYFQTGEMKSSGIGGNVIRRRAVISALSGLSFYVMGFCVQKARLGDPSGLRFSDPFLKYTAKMLCRQLPTHLGVSVVFDAKGRSKFKRSFQEYLRKSFPQKDLFRSMSFSHDDSRASLPIQIADIYAGAIAKRYENFDGPGYLEVSKLISSKSTVWEFPRSTEWGRAPSNENLGHFDAVVRREAFERAWRFIEGFNEQDSDFQLKIAFLKLLVDHDALEDGEFIHSDEVSSRLRAGLGAELDRQAIRNRLVGPLRDHGLLLASSTKGYRIPTTVNDIRRYLEMGNSQIPPALSRIGRTRDIIRSATVGRLDVLDDPEFRGLRAAVESMVKWD